MNNTRERREWNRRAVGSRRRCVRLLPLLAAGVLGCGSTEGALLHARDAAALPRAGEGSVVDAQMPNIDTAVTPEIDAALPPRAPEPVADAMVPPADTGVAAPVATPVRPGMRLHYQLTGTRDIDPTAEVVVIDLFEASDEEVEALHAEGRVVLAYLSAGSFEPWRPDASSFPERVKGLQLANYANENWLDIRSAEVRQLMRARLQRARDKGFDGVFPGALGAYRVESGFPLTEADQLDYDRYLSTQARALGLSPGLSGDFVHARELAPAFDWAIAIGCFAAGSCENLRPLLDQRKAVFNLEVSGEPSELCPQAAALGIVLVLKRRNYDAWSRGCP